MKIKFKQIIQWDKRLVMLGEDGQLYYYDSLHCKDCNVLHKVEPISVKLEKIKSIQL